VVDFSDKEHSVHPCHISRVVDTARDWVPHLITVAIMIGRITDHHTLRSTVSYLRRATHPSFDAAGLPPRAQVTGKFRVLTGPQIVPSCRHATDRYDGQTIQKGCRFKGIPPDLVSHIQRDICSRHHRAPLIRQDCEPELSQVILLRRITCRVFGLDSKFPIDAFTTTL
jgi:hypothetical protein